MSKQVKEKSIRVTEKEKEVLKKALESLNIIQNMAHENNKELADGYRSLINKIEKLCYTH